jgi:hypothetical protein
MTMPDLQVRYRLQLPVEKERTISSELPEIEHAMAESHARESIRDFSRQLIKLQTAGPPFVTKKAEEKAIGLLEEGLRVLIADELHRQGAAPRAIERADQLAQPTHRPGYPAAVEAGAQARTRMFKLPDMLSSEEFSKVAGYSRETVNKKRAEGALLALTNGTRGFRYPKWQLEFPDVMPSLLKIFEGRDPWTVYLFLEQASPYLDEARPLDCLLTGDVERALDAARIYVDETA